MCLLACLNRLNEDPAKDDVELRKQLDENKEIGTKKLEEVSVASSTLCFNHLLLLQLLMETLKYRKQILVLELGHFIIDSCVYHRYNITVIILQRY